MQAFDAGPSARPAKATEQGTFHRLYEVGDGSRLLRVAAMAGPPWTHLMTLECALMARLREEGLAVPACEYAEVGGRGVHRLARVGGASLTSLDEDEPRMSAALGEAARFLARLHRIRGHGFGPLSAGALPQLAGIHERWGDYLRVRLDDHLRMCERIGAVSRRERADIEERFATLLPAIPEVPPALLHGDPGSHNFIVADGRIGGVVDWEDALLGDPLFDLASLCTFQPERRHPAIVSAYGARLEDGGDEWRRFWLYFLRIALAKTVHRHRFGYPDRPGREPAARRIQLALERLGPLS